MDLKSKYYIALFAFSCQLLISREAGRTLSALADEIGFPDDGLEGIILSFFIDQFIAEIYQILYLVFRYSAIKQ